MPSTPRFALLRGSHTNCSSDAETRPRLAAGVRCERREFGWPIISINSVRCVSRKLPTDHCPKCSSRDGRNATVYGVIM